MSEKHLKDVFLDACLNWKLISCTMNGLNKIRYQKMKGWHLVTVGFKAGTMNMG